MALKEVIDEVRQRIRSKDDGQPEQKKNEPETGKRKRRTKEEIEAYRQRKMREEEERYLGEQAEPKKQAKAKKENAKPSEDPRPRNKAKKQAAPSIPKMLGPLEPLYLLRIPGLPKGDCVAICIVHGAGE